MVLRSRHLSKAHRKAIGRAVTRANFRRWAKASKKQRRQQSQMMNGAQLPEDRARRLAAKAQLRMERLLNEIGKKLEGQNEN